MTAAEYFHLAFQFHQAGNLGQAEQLYRQILQIDPNHSDSLHLLGVIAAEKGQYDESIKLIRHAISINSEVGIFHTNLGVAYDALGRFEEAVKAHEQALRLCPGVADVHYNLGTALLNKKEFELAAAQLREALRFRPTYAEAHGNLGLALAELGMMDEAITCYRKALRLKPDNAETHNNLGVALQDESTSSEAIACFLQALQIQPDYAEAHQNLGRVLADQGMFAQAEMHLQEALRLKPTNKTRIMHATMLPPTYHSMADLLAWRQRFTDNVRRLSEAKLTVDLGTERAKHNFYLAYQGFNDKDLQRLLAKLYAAPAAPSTASRLDGLGKKIRIGFISHFFKDHTIAKLMRGLIANFSRKQFHVTVLAIGRERDPTTQWIRERADRFVELPPRIGVASRLIAEQDLDVLFYTDIGMEPITYSLAFFRLAPVQCVTWGHPVTTGIPTMDYFISSELLETKEADEHYTEKLVRLKNLAIYYYRPTPPTPLKSRKHFGLPASGALYVCPQSLFKFHPDFDEILAGILRRDPQGTLVLLKTKQTNWDQMLRQRFVKTLPDALNRGMILPPQNHADFLNLNALATVLLDPLHFGGGNTSYEGLALGVPIVTLPSQFLRGRITLALYKQMDFMDCVVSGPQEYIDLAVKLGTNPDYRSAISARILAANNVLFENSAGLHELEAFLTQAVTETRPGLEE